MNKYLHYNMMNKFNNLSVVRFFFSAMMSVINLTQIKDTMYKDRVKHYFNE